jgi:hypothetical protein
MARGHTPYGYRIENGLAVIDEEQAAQVKMLCEGYLAGMGLSAAAEAAGLKTYHASAMRMMLNRHYLGDGFYPAILSADMREKIEAERQRRATLYGRDRRQPLHKTAKKPGLEFEMDEADQHFDDPYRQAEYLYSLIRRTD